MTTHHPTPNIQHTSCCKDTPESLALEQPNPILLVASCVLINQDNHILISKRLKDTHQADKWEFPGGKIQANESPQTALIRELKEELGITLCTNCLLPLTFTAYAYPKFHLLMPIFSCRNWEGEPTGAEGQELKWIKPNQLKDHPMPPANTPILGLIRDAI